MSFFGVGGSCADVCVNIKKNINIMGHQKGIIKLKGRVGDLAFYKTRNLGFQARSKDGIEGERILKDASYSRTRENMSEFARAMKAGKFFRSVFRSITVNTSDSGMSNRLGKLMTNVVKNDLVNDRGERVVTPAALELLAPFEFNEKAPVSSTLHLPYHGDIIRATGKLFVHIDTFVPRDSISAPTGTTHFKFTAAAAMIDFDQEVSEFMVNMGEMIAYDRSVIQYQAMECMLTPALAQPLFLLIGISFYQEVNGKYYPLSNGANNGLCLINVLGV